MHLKLLFLEFHPDIRFHLEIHPALLSEELKEELSLLPKGLLHLEAGIQSHAYAKGAYEKEMEQAALLAEAKIHI